jgi:hypothetical protein
MDGSPPRLLDKFRRNQSMKTNKYPVFWYALPKGWTEDDLTFVFGTTTFPVFPLPFAELQAADSAAVEHPDLTKNPSNYVREIRSRRRRGQ